MKITMEATDKLTTMEGVPVRVWEGATERGVRCLVFVHRIGVGADEDDSQFQAELAEQLPPGRVIPLRNIL